MAIINSSLVGTTIACGFNSLVMRPPCALPWSAFATDSCRVFTYATGENQCIKSPEWYDEAGDSLGKNVAENIYRQSRSRMAS